MIDRENILISDARIILFGSEGGFSRPALEQLIARDLNIVTVVMLEPLPDKNFPVKIKQAAKRSSLEALATNNAIKILKTPDLHEKGFINQLYQQRGDILLAACFAHKIPACIWQKMKLPCWNLHPSLLPAYRGPAPLYWQLKNRETDTGLTLHKVSDKIDAGDILAQEKVALPENHDRDSLDGWVSVNGVNLFYNTLSQYLCKELKSAPQNEMFASYFPAPRHGTSI